MITLKKRTLKINFLFSTNNDLHKCFIRFLMNFSENYKHKNGGESREEA